MTDMTPDEILARVICEADIRRCRDFTDEETLKAMINEEWDAYADDARAGIAALEAAGYAVVPVEPTRDMIKAGSHHEYERCVWSAMIAARPQGDGK